MARMELVHKEDALCTSTQHNGVVWGVCLDQGASSASSPRGMYNWKTQLVHTVTMKDTQEGMCGV